MQIPVSTYRLQFSPEFTFSDLQHMLDYLEKLQVSTIYAAPIFQSMEGSTHGYDMVNPWAINEGIGLLEEWKLISSKLREKEMNWLQDIVPNHMANSPANPWMNSVLEHGPASPYFHFFDINWEYPAWKGKIMAPFLGESLDNAIDNGSLKIIFKEEGFRLRYFENEYPLSDISYAKLLSQGQGGKSPDISDWVSKFKNLPTKEEQWKALKESFYQSVQHQESIKEMVEASLLKCNSSKNELMALLDLQYFNPIYWKDSEKQINFRRFFTINDLICLRMENEQVFHAYHTFIHQLCREGLINGLRIDHIDGLFDPKIYLDRLDNLLGNDFFVVIEKILESGESLPTDWKMQGTSGYDFLGSINNLYTSSKNKEIFLGHYKRINPEFSNYSQQVFEMKQYILHERMGGELQNLWALLEELNLSRHHPGLKKERGLKALGVFLAAFPVYRIYFRQFPLSPDQLHIIEEAYSAALVQVPELKEELVILKDIFTGKAGAQKKEMGYFLQRCQQFTGPLAAKGVEDTTFYRYHLLISHNEVGDSPEIFGISIEKFHQIMQWRQKNYPHTLNTTATHDTKRGEDARMRINVLSEIPEEWFALVDDWHQTNKNLRKDAMVPDLNEEYFVYQSLLGAMAFQEEDQEVFLNRTKAYLQKALREAKEHTSWSDPDLAFEESIADFVQKILNHPSFRESFDPFHRKTAFYGVINSLGQSLIKIMAPGIPDIYQGSELWDLSYVDPDNRRPVDYRLRNKYLDELQQYGDKVEPTQLLNLMTNYKDGKIKLFTIFRTMKERRLRPAFFEKAEYLPIVVSDSFKDKVISFARFFEGLWYLVVVPLNATALCEPGQFPLKSVWDDGFLELPGNSPKAWINIHTGEEIATGNQVGLSSLFVNFPVVLLRSKEF
ncbi:MAG: malto-oligosyltrehalose synthase [Cyclobacteriaceae bacterium]